MPRKFVATRPPPGAAQVLFDRLRACAPANAGGWPVFAPVAGAEAIVAEWLATEPYGGTAREASTLAAERSQLASECLDAYDPRALLVLGLLRESRHRGLVHTRKGPAHDGALKGAAHLLLMLLLPKKTLWGQGRQHFQNHCANLFQVQVLCPNPTGELALYGAEDHATGGVYIHVPSDLVDADGRPQSPPRRPLQDGFGWAPNHRFLADPLADAHRLSIDFRQAPRRGASLPTTKQLRCERWLDRAMEDARVNIGLADRERFRTLLDPVQTTATVQYMLREPLPQAEALLAAAARCASRPETRAWCSPPAIRAWAVEAVTAALLGFSERRWSEEALTLCPDPPANLAIAPARRLAAAEKLPGVLMLLDNYAREQLTHDGEPVRALEHVVQLDRCHAKMVLCLECTLLALAGHHMHPQWDRQGPRT